MNNIKTEFSIKDLENLSKIKAHTIRIWEKRYNLLQPKRSDTNIRSYDIENLQKLLNVTFLNNNGYKISKISKLKDSQIPTLVQEIAINGQQKHQAINTFKMAMLNFDMAMFNKTYNELLREHSFEDIFYKVFIQLLDDIGVLWQTDTITPAHEHFISTLIKQKVLINLEKAHNGQVISKDKAFVLFLPLNEIHDIGLLFVAYQLAAKGYHCIYLGQSVPIESLEDFKGLYREVVFVSYFTIKPELDELDNYLKNINDSLITNSKNKFITLGQQSHALFNKKLPNNFYIYKSISDLVKDL